VRKVLTHRGKRKRRAKSLEELWKKWRALLFVTFVPVFLTKRAWLP
jgi:hypothetical protein